MFYPHRDMITENFSDFLAKEAYEPGVVNLGEAFNVRRRQQHLSLRNPSLKVMVTHGLRLDSERAARALDGRASIKSQRQRRHRHWQQQAQLNTLP